MILYKKENGLINNKIKEIIESIINSEKVSFIILFAVMVYIHTFHKMDAGDDYWFQQVTKDYTFINYMHLRYFTWTGRMTSEAIFYYIFRDNGFLWKILNPIFITLLAYGISRIVIGKKKNRENALMNWYICIGVLFISKGVFLDAIMWMTGSIVYLWGMVFALLAMIPFRDVVKGEYKEKLGLLYIIFAALASMSEEQVALVLLAFAVIVNIHIYVRDKKIHKYLLIENVVILVGTGILFLAPGNFVRKVDETINWMPNFPMYSKWEVGYYGIQWLLNILLNNCKVIFFLLLLTLSIAIYYKDKGTKNSKVAIIPMIGSFLLGSSIIFSMDTTLPGTIIQNIRFPRIYHYIGDHLNAYMFDFNTPNPFAFTKLLSIKFFVWPVIIAVAAYLICYLYDFKMEGFYVALAYIGGICSAIIMFVSPTMYASGLRTFFVLVVMFLFVFVSLLRKCENLLIKRCFIVFAAFGVFKYIFIFLLK